ncbi:MAG: ABC transporter ATP-binding protein [Verrucomicrobiae bacterium]|nr:ABC transporter ATP-binding protein [Verrucomicrobiae bacterium]MCP5541697.1 ABC transporter ATP-binding protein [Akkermansiaceae bacterium]MCP5551685.1 ABC transporter ATP-binding protein [Akkermansiaceae bacterium]
MTEIPALETAGVRKVFKAADGEVLAIDDVSLTLGAGEFVALHGASGCGKSTLLLMAGGLLSPDGGEIRVAGENPYALGPEARAAFRAEKAGFVFQQFHLVPYLGVLDNLLVSDLAGANGGGAAGRESRREKARSLLAEFNLSHRAGHVPSKLSTGEQQRVALARALMGDPRLILADEPTGNLDAENAAVILDRLSRFAADGKGAVLMVTHDERAKAAAGRSLEMREGRLV